MSRAISLLKSFATWYRTPAGVVSLGFIGLIIVLAALGWTGPAVIASVIWVGFIVPHKLMRERRDWEQALRASQHVGQLEAESHREELAKIRGQLRKVVADLTKVPTGTEVRHWQQSVEVAQSTMNVHFEEVLEDIQGSQIYASFHRSSLQSAIDGMSDVKSAEGTRSELFREVQKVSALYSLLSPGPHLPDLAESTLSSDSAWELSRCLLRRQPEHVVMFGAGTPTTIAALAVAQNLNGDVTVFEDDAGHAHRTRKQLADAGLGKLCKIVEVGLTDVRVNGKGHLWFDLAADIAAFSDAPIDVLFLGARDWAERGISRSCAPALLADSLTSDSIVLLDGPAEEDDANLETNWQQDYGLVLSGTTSDGQLRTFRFLGAPLIS